jgi:hypothetical protein
MRLSHATPGRNSRRRGQTVVEFALVAPVLILLMLMAIDVGRVFLGWVALNNASRVGANYAAGHPNDASWGAGTEYQALISANIDAINCTRNPALAAPPTFASTRDPGDPVTVNLSCDFNVLTPGAQVVLGGSITVFSSSTFPVTYGCLADCVGGPAAPPVAPPDNCRTVPDVVDLSVSGAKAAWVAAGFAASNFHPTSGDETRTVENYTVSEPLNDEDCLSPKAFFGASMTVTLEDLGPVTSPTCVFVPTLRGISVATARMAWTDAGFTGAFLPTGNDARVVVDQVTDPVSDPGDCVEPVTSITVSHQAPPGPPPPPPCKVPSFVNTSSAAATGTWTQAGFGASNIHFTKGNTYQILSQTLVGGTYVGCASDITVSHKAPNTP